MLEPSKIISYLIYRCPSCKHDSDMIRMGEAQGMNSYYCSNCEAHNNIRKISGVSPVFGDRVTEYTGYNLGDKDIKSAIDMVRTYSDDAIALVGKILRSENPITVETLIVKSIALIEDE